MKSSSSRSKAKVKGIGQNKTNIDGRGAALRGHKFGTLWTSAEPKGGRFCLSYRYFSKR